MITKVISDIKHCVLCVCMLDSVSDKVFRHDKKIYNIYTIYFIIKFSAYMHLFS